MELSYGHSGNLKVRYSNFSSPSHWPQKSKCLSVASLYLSMERYYALSRLRSHSPASIECMLPEGRSLEGEHHIIASTVSAVSSVIQSPCALGHENSSQTTLQEIGESVGQLTETTDSGSGISPSAHGEGTQVSMHGRKIWCRSNSAVKMDSSMPQGKFVAFQDGQQVLQPDYLINIDELLDSLKGISSEEELCDMMADWKMEASK